MARMLQHGSSAWFEMVGDRMCEAVACAGLPADLTVSLVERYIDGLDLGAGLVQGLRLDIVRGRPSFRAGARPGETGDITIVITAEAAHRLNRLFAADPAYAEALDSYRASGAMTVEGDPARLGAWLGDVHDEIVARTL